MLTLYLTCMIVGGVFVGLSSLGAFGKDVDASHDTDLDADGHLELGPGVDVDADVDHEIVVEHDFDASHALTVADASHGGDITRRDERRHGRKLWLPITSFRFWTFGSAFFGLTGTLLTALTGAPGVVIAGLSSVMGAGAGTLSASLVRWLRKPVGEGARLRDYSGLSGVTVLALREGGLTRVRVRLQGRERDILARAAEPMALPAGTRVIVLGFDENGRAQIAPEETIYQLEES